jgi:hypothetical protein
MFMLYVPRRNPEATLSDKHLLQSRINSSTPLMEEFHVYPEDLEVPPVDELDHNNAFTAQRQRNHSI